MKKNYVIYLGAVGLIASVVGLGSSNASASTIETESVHPASKANSSIAGDSVIVTERVQKVENLFLLSEPMEDMNIVTYLKKNIRYPESAIDQGIEGYVKIFCTLEKNGEMSNVYAVEASNDELSAEVTRILKKAKFQPIVQNGVPAKVSLIIPVSFDLTKSMF